jgi:hypothetical protein
MTVWTIEEAVELVRSIQPHLHAVRWHATLGGGTLNRGSSEKDCDVYVLPFSGEESSTSALGAVAAHWGAYEPMSETGEYADDPRFDYMVKFIVGGKRVDCFVLRGSVPEDIAQ